MRARHVAVVTAVLVALAGCGGASEAATDTPAAKAPAAAAATDSDLPPEPDAATAKAYVAALKKIDPEIVGDDEERVIGRGRNECSTVKSNSNDEDELIKSTNQRFSTPDKPDGFGTKKATKILAAVRKYLCPTY
ncbi:hypothetical protein [Actinoplanes sp. NPDC051494]|uniref:hypothetical protein n=1 Tax=Actinoplanes sp. NPDC051494 TaxID=3363907 RepID=UPI0037947F6B